MLSNISWTTYWSVIGAILFIYYLSICLKYYSFEFKQILSGKLKLSIMGTGGNLLSTAPLTDEASVIYELKQGINKILGESKQKNLIKEEILFALQLLFQNHKIPNNTDLKGTITDYILSASQNNCSIHLDEEDLSGLWVKEVNGASIKTATHHKRSYTMSRH